MKIIELIIDEGEDNGVNAISLVKNPAIESDFLALKSDEVLLKTIDDDKRLLVGALLIPNKPIMRKNEEGNYYIYFSKDTVEKASQKFLMNNNQHNATLEHKIPLSGMTLVESWIVENKKQDKSAYYGLDVPVGTWMGTMKVQNEDTWQEVKSGKIKGFSIEGYFADKIEASKYDPEKEAENLLNKIKNILA